MSLLPRPFAAALALFGSASCTSTHVETEHYLAVFDPQRQVAQEFYRIRIIGHSQPLSRVQYASGWVPAAAADLLTRAIELDEDDAITIDGSDSPISISPTRQFYEIGPLAVATAPDDARFVVVMDSNPDQFFEEVEAIAAINGVREEAESRSATLLGLLLERERVDEALAGLQAEED